MKVTLKPLIACCDYTSKSLNQGKCWLPFPPFTFFSMQWLQVRQISTALGVRYLTDEGASNKKFLQFYGHRNPGREEKKKGQEWKSSESEQSKVPLKFPATSTTMNVMNKSLHGHSISIFLGKYQELELLGYIYNINILYYICNFIRNC